MEIVIHLSEAAARRAEAAAAARGVEVARYLGEMLDLLLDPPEPSPFCATPEIERSVREALRPWIERAARPHP